MPTRTNKATAPDRYMELIQGFRLRPIGTATAYEAAMKVMDAIMKRDDLNDDEEDYADVLAGLIEQYEQEHFPVSRPSGVDVLRFLIEQSGRTQTQVAREAGLAESAMSEILKGKRGLGRKHIAVFAKVFKVNPGVFIPLAE